MSSAAFDRKELGRLLDHDNLDTRGKFRDLFYSKLDLMTPRYNQALDDQRELAYKRLKAVCGAGIVSIQDFGRNPLNIFAAHEMLGMVDGSLATKFTVHMNLFGGSMYALTTERHAQILKGIDKMDYTGCFCLTELGYGNNAVEMETTATYDAATDEFIVNSPSPLSQKYWITNGACHAEWAVVFAQLITNDKKEGVHAFIVRIRNSDRTPCKGVFIEDMGIKIGLNAIDNARIAFNNVRIPRTHLLNRFSEVHKGGQYESKIVKKRDRFLYIANRLLSGRVCISAMSIGGGKAILYDTIKYALQRKGVGASGKSDTPIMAYQLQQNALIPLVARFITLTFGFNYVKEMYADLSAKQAAGGNPSPPNELVRLCCLIKPLVTWHANKSANIFRERCGGQGYLSINRVGQGMEFSHAGMTAEGDNSVLMQKVTKELMTDLRNGEVQLPQMTLCPKRQLPDLLNLNDLGILENLLIWREAHLVEKLTTNMMQKVMKDRRPLFDVWMGEESDLIQAVAKAHGERIVFAYCLKLLRGQLPKDTRYYRTVKTTGKLLDKIFRLYALEIVRDDVGMFLINGIISKVAAGNLNASINGIIKEIYPHLNDIVESFDVLENQWCPIAANYVRYNDAPNNGEVTPFLRPKL